MINCFCGIICMFIVHSVKCRIEFVGNLLHLQYPICSMVLNIYQHLHRKWSKCVQVWAKILSIHEINHYKPDSSHLLRGPEVQSYTEVYPRRRRMKPSRQLRPSRIRRWRTCALATIAPLPSIQGDFSGTRDFITRQAMFDYWRGSHG